MKSQLIFPDHTCIYYPLYWHRGKLSQYPHICPNILRNKAISILHSISLISPDLVFQKGTLYGISSAG